MQGGGTRIRLVLVGTEGEINLGFIARLAANFRVDEFYLVDPKVSPASEEARRFAANGAYMLERINMVKSLDEALAGVGIAACTSARTGQRSDVLRHAVSVREFATELAPRYDSVAVVFGRESVGLTREELSKCHVLVHIPANPEYPVLNLSHAVAIVLYELWTALRFEGRIHEQADSASLERIYGLLRGVAEELIDRERLPAVDAAIKHLLWKSRMTSGEASALYQFAKKLRRLVEECRGSDAQDSHTDD
ncbi:RNA methyltransferase [Pyrodictium abyssi]|uniref:tRNA (Cytidine-2'-O-)-methyltransferase TrmJ n=1 Tax=Pyrodictium abyssi TaxID=54256 RepID=A0ABN6ZKF1_9CREN|nr:tRNA (cytidine-2'-O-)-methyltransferase TrmJ [Pyrodictium abyssi]